MNQLTFQYECVNNENTCVFSESQNFWMLMKVTKIIQAAKGILLCQPQSRVDALHRSFNNLVNFEV